VTGARPVTVEGRRLDCYNVERTTTMSGDVTGTQRQRTCWLPTLGMPAVDEQELQGTYQGITFKARATMTLAEPPAGNPERQVQDGRPDLASRESVRRSSRAH
jgi:hypothetical protein